MGNQMKFPRPLIGDYTYDLLKEQQRSRVYLPRNMTRVLAYHEKSRSKAVTTTTNDVHQTTLRRIVTNTENSPVSALDPNKRVVNSTRPLNGHSLHSVKSLPDGPSACGMETASMASSVRRSQVSDYSAPGRRSLRKLQEISHHDKDAELSLDLKTIRKKLNFREVLSNHEVRPRKRQKRESVRCQCHLTIWDNRGGLAEAEPVIKKSQYCAVSASDGGSNGYVVDIELEKNFTIKSSELKVPVDRDDESVLALVDKYFLEIKIIPTRSDTDWPPIPLLGKSDGDHFAGLSKTISEKLQGALVARYIHLPKAPAHDVPLSVFFLQDGRTYRTKYGLGVKAEWVRAELAAMRIKNEPGIDEELDIWSIDSHGNDFGRPPTAIDNKSTTTVVSKLKKRKTGRISGPSTDSKESLKVIVHYFFDGPNLRATPKEFRKAEVAGFGCPACPSQSFTTLPDLRFHLINHHHRYQFIVEKEDRDTTCGEVKSVHFKVMPAEAPKPQKGNRPKPKEAFEMHWTAPKDPFDLPSYVNGDHSWVGVVSKKRGPGSTMPIVPDPIAQLRRQHGGFLPAELVPEFRKAERKKHPIQKLRVLTEDKETMYTSISHRPLRMDEEARSESDDEIDVEWLVGRHMETLDATGERDGWSRIEIELRKRWDKHRLSEGCEHPKYLSDSLVRFVRVHWAWLGQQKVKEAWLTFLVELQNKRVVNDEILRDLHELVFGVEAQKRKELEAAMEDGHMAESNQAENTLSLLHNKLLKPASELLQNWSSAESRRARAEALLSLPQGTCGLCTKHIIKPAKEGVRCADNLCDAPAVLYHLNCVRCKQEERLAWCCAMCGDRKAEEKARKEKEAKGKGKGKERTRE